MVLPLLAPHAQAKAIVVACALATSRGERFESDAQALHLFLGVALRTEHVVSKLEEFAPAGSASRGSRPPRRLAPRSNALRFARAFIAGCAARNEARGDPSVPVRAASRRRPRAFASHDGGLASVQ